MSDHANHAKSPASPSDLQSFAAAFRARRAPGPIEPSSVAEAYAALEEWMLALGAPRALSTVGATEDEVRRLRAATDDMSRFARFPAAAILPALGLVVARSRALTDALGATIFDSPSRPVAKRVQLWVQETRVGKVQSLKRDALPEHGTWTADAEQLWRRLDRLTAAPAAASRALGRAKPLREVPASASSTVRLSSAPAREERATPNTVLDALEAAMQRTTHVVYLPSAVTSARATPYMRPQRVYEALLAIDDVARRWAEQLAGGAPLGSRKAAFAKHGFEYKNYISQTAEGRWGEEYTYEHGGRRVVFEAHITIGKKQAHKCLSIHMHWDEASRRVVIAHVGRHKTNTRS